MRRTADSALRRRAALLTAPATVTLAVVGGLTASAQARATITVNSTSTVVDFGGGQTVGDLPGPDGLTSFPEALLAATNTAGADPIGFDIPTTDSGFTGTEFVIRHRPVTADDELRVGDDATTIDATTQPGGFGVVLDGSPLVIGESRTGLRITSSENTVIGLGVRGYANGIGGLGGSNNRIIGVTGTGNLNAVQLSGFGTGTGGEVSGCTIRDNQGVGIVVGDLDDAVVDGNTVVGNGGSGVLLGFGTDRATVTDNLIRGNSRGLNHQGGVGGVATGNTITDNRAEGFFTDGGRFIQQFTLTRNSIADNGRLGIQLLSTFKSEDEFGVTRNDAQDRDGGANGLLNFPELVGATDDGTATTLQGHVEFPDPESLTIEVYANAAPDPSGHGEGETFLTTATADRKGRFTATLPAGLAGQWLTATATDALGNTSEFSNAVQVAVPR